jgi:hypothetical protein
VANNKTGSDNTRRCTNIRGESSARQRDEPHTRIEERSGEEGGGTSRDMTRHEETNRGRYSKRKIKRKKEGTVVDGWSER